MIADRDRPAATPAVAPPPSAPCAPLAAVAAGWRPRSSTPRGAVLAAAGALLVASFAASSAAGAGAPSDVDPVVVELYRQARELVNAGRWDEGCPRFEQAMAKQPTASILINVGDCHAHRGKLVKAMESYDVARELNRGTRDEGRRVALTGEIEQRVKQLAPRVPSLRIIVENPVAGMVIRCDGAPLAAEKIGVDIPFDPGEHVVTAEAAAHDAEPRRVTLAEGARERVTLKLVRRPFASQHGASIALGAGAIALAGAGAALAGWTVSTHGALPETCARGAAECAGARRDLEVGSIATNVAFAAAGAAAGAAVLVFVVAERPKSPAVQAAVTGTFATVRVTW